MPQKNTGTARPLSRPKRLAAMEKEARALASDYQVWFDTFADSKPNRTPIPIEIDQ